MTRRELANKIRIAHEEIKTAGYIHRKDLAKNLRRMKKELRDYDRFHAEAERR